MHKLITTAPVTILQQNCQNKVQYTIIIIIIISWCFEDTLPVSNWAIDISISIID